MMKQNEIIYQIFPRNYSKEGTFSAIEQDLERIKALGTTIVYLMPINEIGIKNRKGVWGSPYASRDYYSISKDLGTLADLKSLIEKTHKLGMKIIVDMVFNHTAPDSILFVEHPEYYFYKNGKPGNKVGDWSDIIDLNHDNPQTEEYLLGVLKYWIGVGFDGFRFDVASMIPLPFFVKARKELGGDVIFIGESVDTDFAKYLRKEGIYCCYDREMFPTFDALYNYNYFHQLYAYVKGKAPLDGVVEELNRDKDSLRLLCLENHDTERASSEMDQDRFIRFLDFIAFIKGSLFIYAGGEFGNKHRPELFEKDPVDFSYRNQALVQKYEQIIAAKRKQKEIVDISYRLKSKDEIVVSLVYQDGEKEEKTFNLGK